MTGTEAHTEARVLGSVDQLFDAVVGTDPSQFYPRFGPLPAVVSVTDRSGDFSVVGSHRRLHLSDGSAVTETVRAVDPNVFHLYRLTGFTGLFGRLVDHADAEWTFGAEGSAAAVHWSYTFVGKPGRGWIVALIVRLFWARYMTVVLPPIARQAGPLA